MNIVAVTFWDQFTEFFEWLSAGWSFVWNLLTSISNFISSFFININYTPLTVFIGLCVGLLFIAAIIILVIRLL